MKDLETDTQDVAITKAIIVMAETLGLRVVAEGIETEMQEMILIANGCKCGQGFLYSRPIWCYNQCRTQTRRTICESGHGSWVY